jgi:transposase
MTIVEDRPVITGGVDTHADMHVAAALDPIGGLLGVRELPATAAGYAGLLHWLAAFGDVALVGVEGTGSYGAGLARHLAAAGVRVVEVDRADRQDRHRAAKSDPLDAVSAARAAQCGRAAGAPKGRDGAVEAIRALIAELAALRPRPGGVPGYATRVALRELGRRAQFLDAQLERLDELIIPLVTARVPGLLSLHGVGPDTAALLLIAAGDHPEGYAARPRGRICAGSRRSPRPQGRSAGIVSTAVATARLTMPCGGS